MQISYSDQPFPKEVIKSIFLAGPSPRSLDVHDWKYESVSILEDIGFDGTIYIPVLKNVFLKGYFDYRLKQGKTTKLINLNDYEKIKDVKDSWDYDNQIEWEVKARNRADVNLFWIPRSITGSMPGFTTNIEFGEDLYNGKMIYGRPNNAEKCSYLDKRVLMLNKNYYTSLEHTIAKSLSFIGSGAIRANGETCVPLMVWKTQEFQSWYKNLLSAGNKLEFANLKNSQFIEIKKGDSYEHVLFSYMMDVHVWIEKEKRSKTNEFIFSRKDISVVNAFYKGDDGQEYIVLVKEFRSPVNNQDGYVWELPGGSSVKPGIDPQENAQKELFEETGLAINDKKRFVQMPSRQLLSTLSIHKAHPYSIYLTKEEFLFLKNQKNACGNLNESERTFVEIVNLNEIFDKPIDASMLGIIFESSKKLELINQKQYKGSI